MYCADKDCDWGFKTQLNQINHNPDFESNCIKRIYVEIILFHFIHSFHTIKKLVYFLLCSSPFRQKKHKIIMEYVIVLNVIRKKIECRLLVEVSGLIVCGAA